ARAGRTRSGRWTPPSACGWAAASASAGCGWPTSAAARSWRPRFSPLAYWAAVGGPGVQAALRQAFARWGLPGALRVDNGQAWERRRWDVRAAREHLAGYAVPRRVRGQGEISVYERDLYVGTRYAGRVVYVQFDPVAVEWVATDEHDGQLRRWPAPEISRERI